MAQHCFALGQVVEFVEGFRDLRPEGSGPYTVLRLLPGAAAGREYRIKNIRDGHERMAVEAQLRASPP